jgi:hypothetical protein
MGVSLQPSLSKYRELLQSYKTLVKWISDKHVLAEDGGEIFVQGSFAIDTAVQPLRKNEIDVDVVAAFSRVWKQGEQVGIFYDKLEDIFADSRYESKCERYKNVVRINYNSNFHFDIMPTLPIFEDNYDYLKAVDTKKRNWVDRSPKLYARWFVERAKTESSLIERFDSNKYRSSFDIFQEMEEIPFQRPSDYYVKPALTRVVQIVKRARDIFFRDKEIVPQSIVLTTIIAEAYSGESSMYRALLESAKHMYRLAKSDKMFRVLNPVSANEEFTDKWQMEPEYYDAFRRFAYWFLFRVRSLRTDNRNHARDAIQKIAGQGTVQHISESSHARWYYTGFLSMNSNYEKEELTEKYYEMDLCSYVEIDCMITKASTKKKVRLRSKKTTVDIGDYLHFYIADTNVDRPFKVRWKVRNFGDHARQNEQIRGTIIKGNNDNTLDEPSSFGGHHYVECYLVVGKKIVATDRIDVPIGRDNLEGYDI